MRRSGSRSSLLQSLSASSAQSTPRISAENLRNSVRQIIDSGIVGGERLNQAFEDYQKEENERLFCKLQEEFNMITRELTNVLAGLQDCQFEKSDNLTAKINGNFSQKTAAPNYYGTITGSLGGITSTAVGVVASKLVVAKSTAVGAIMGSAIPGVGTTVGAVVGFVGGLAASTLGLLIGSKIGKKLGQIHIGSQKDKARQELFMHIDEYQKINKNNYKNVFSNFTSEIDSSIRTWLSKQENLIEVNYKNAKNDLIKPIEEKKAIQKQIETDLNLIEEFNKRIVNNG